MQLSVSIARTNDDQCGDLDEGIEDYCISMRRAAGRTAMVEVNVSCPNTHVGEPFTATPEALDRLFTALDKIDRPQPTPGQDAVEQAVGRVQGTARMCWPSTMCRGCPSPICRRTAPASRFRAIGRAACPAAVHQRQHRADSQGV